MTTARKSIARRLEIASTWNGISIGADERATVDVHLDSRAERMVVEFRAPLHGDPAPPDPPGELDGLWNYEVVELFLAGPAGGSSPPGSSRALYIELEVGPWEHFLALAFSAPRRRSTRLRPTSFEVKRRASRWRARLSLPFSDLPSTDIHRLRANAFALHGNGRQHPRRHLAAIPVPGELPDFHQLDLMANLESYPAPPQKRPGEAHKSL